MACTMSMNKENNKLSSKEIDSKTKIDSLNKTVIDLKVDSVSKKEIPFSNVEVFRENKRKIIW